MAPRDHEGNDRAMRLILSGGDIHLAAEGRLVHIDSADHLAALIERVLVVEAPAGTVPKVPVETMRAMTRNGDRLRIETMGQRSDQPVLVPPQRASVMATLLDGHYNDRWTAEAFGVDLVNAGAEPCEVILDLYLPHLGDDESGAKVLTVETDVDQQAVEVHRGGATPLALPVATGLSVGFRTMPEPFQGSDARSRGVLIASIRDGDGQVADIFHLSAYFD